MTHVGICYGDHLRIPVDVQGEVRDVTLRRMARAELADHVRMFELFTRVKMVAASIGEDTAQMEDGSEASLSECVDDCIRLWTDMSHADADHSKAMAANIAELKNDCNDCVRLLFEALSRVVHCMREPAIEHLESSLFLAMNEPALKVLLRVLRKVLRQASGGGHLALQGLPQDEGGGCFCAQVRFYRAYNLRSLSDTAVQVGFQRT